MKLFALFCLIGLALAKERYDGHKVVDVSVETEEKFNQLNEIRNNPILDLDFWTEPHIGGKAKVHVNPESEAMFFELLDTLNIESEIVETNIQKYLDQEDKENELSAPLWAKHESPIGKFATYEEIMMYLNHLDISNSHVTLSSLGKSFEKRDIPLIKISSGKADRSVFIDGGIHAREWLSQATVMYVIDALVRGYGSNSAITEAINKFDWYITPVLNPDGYVYTHTGQRFWRKTRTVHNRIGCNGADPNRNFNYPSFGGPMTSNDPCQEIYHGPYAFSEPCVARFRDFFLSNKMDMYFSFHAYSQLLFVPWAYTLKRPADAADLDRVAYIGQKAIQKVNGIKFTVGTPGQILYPAGSSSIDWVKGTAGVKYAYGAELRPGMDAFMGFVIDKKFIKPSGEEILAGLLAMTDAAKF